MPPRTLVRSAGLCFSRRSQIHTYSLSRHLRPSRNTPAPTRTWQPMQRRMYATEKSMADERIEEIQEQYATAKDEFEIAVEETEKKTVYAADDRAAAADEFTKLKELYEAAVKESPPDVAKEIQSRVGQRIRELDHAIQGLEKSAMED